MPASRAAFAMVATPARTTRWLGRLPSMTRAAGVDGSSPPATSAAVIAGRVRTPISTTIVEPAPARAAQSTVESE